MEIVLVLIAAVFVAAAPLVGRIVGANVLLLLLLLRTFGDGSLLGISIAGQSPGAVIGIAILFVSVPILLRGRGLTAAVTVFGFLAISTAFAASGATGGQAWVVFLAALSAVAFGLAFANLRKPPDILAVSRWIQLIALVSAVFSLIQWVLGTGLVVDGVVRPAGLMAHPNSAALVYSIAVMVTIFRFGRARSAWWDRGALVVLLLALAVTGSLGGVTTLLAMLLAYAFASGALKGHGRAGVALVCVFIAIAFAFSPIGIERLTAFTSIDLSGANGERNSLEWRVGRWRTLIEMWSPHPAFGLGYGSATSGSLLQGGYPPHDEYVRVLVDTGIVGCLIALIALIMLFRWTSRIIRHDPNVSTRRLAGVINAILVGLLVNGLTENTFTYSIPMYMLGALLGTLAQASRHPAVSFSDRRSVELERT